LGGGGFLGYHLSQALLAAGHRVRIFDRPNINRFAVSSRHTLEWVEGDFINEEDLESAISGCDTIYHFVSTTLPKTSNDNPIYDVETNVVGTLHLLDLVRQQSGRKIIFISSGGTVYGIPREVPIKESHPTDPICSYGVAKLTIEKYLALYHQLYGLDYFVIRPSNPFGEKQRITGAQGAVAVFLHKALHDEPIEIWGDGTVVRDFIYVGDLIDALVRALTYTGDCRIFNIGSGKGRSLNELLSEIETLLGRQIRRTYMQARAFDVPSNVLDISMAARHLNWQPQIPFRDGLERTQKWVAANDMRRGKR
jgi:UDP-glucose 4-epimerase